MLLGIVIVAPGLQFWWQKTSAGSFQPLDKCDKVHKVGTHLCVRQSSTTKEAAPSESDWPRNWNVIRWGKSNLWWLPQDQEYWEQVAQPVLKWNRIVDMQEDRRESGWRDFCRIYPWKRKHFHVHYYSDTKEEWCWLSWAPIWSSEYSTQPWVPCRSEHSFLGC